MVRGNVAIRCPWCGSADPSHHMGIAVEGDRRGNWGCWRNSAHRGKSPVKLIQALIGCSFNEAKRIAGVKAASEFGSDSDVLGDLQTMLGDGPEQKEIEPIKWPKEFKRLETPNAYTKQFIHYLVTKRGYETDEAWDLCRVYSLRYAVHGAFAYRLIIPLRMPQGLVGWTGRTISDDENLRYKSLSEKPETAERERMPCAPMNIKDCVWNYRNLLKDTFSEMLVVVEGPLDALRVDYFGRPFGIRSTCLFSKSVTAAQEDLLASLARMFKKKVLLLDDDASTDAFGIYTQLERHGFTYRTLADGDPAELSPRQVKALASS